MTEDKEAEITKPLAIVANGAPLATPEEWAGLAQCAAVAYCDRAPLNGSAVPPTAFIIGDGDTLSHAVPFIHDPDQETNDLTKALRYAKAHYEVKSIAWFCVTGLREDHTLANLALISEYGLPGTVYTNTGRFTLLLAGTHALHVQPDTPISFISFSRQSITATGVVWQVNDLLLDGLWRATLNRTSMDCVSIRNEAPLYVYQPWSSK